MDPITVFTSKAVALPINDIDTDQIIPARFLKTTSKTGLGEVLFHDWRQEPDFVLNREQSRGAQVLIAGDNFGCGSSREHAPWALYDWGLRAIVSTSFADIFRNNALKNGLLPIAVDPDTHRALLAAAEKAPVEVTVDLAEQTFKGPGGISLRFEIDAFARRCLLAGTDQLGYLLGHDGAIAAYEAAR